MCPAVGEDRTPYGGSKATSRYFMAARKLHNQGRAVNVLLWQGTQDPTDQNLPKLVREGAHLRGSLALGTESQSRMALGDKAVDGGAAPHTLRQGLDKGTLVVAGDGVKLAPGQSSTTVRTHFIGGEDATNIAERAKAKRKPVTTNDHAVEDEIRDLLDDLAIVLGRGDRIERPNSISEHRNGGPGLDLGPLFQCPADPRSNGGMFTVDPQGLAPGMAIDPVAYAGAAVLLRRTRTRTRSAPVPTARDVNRAAKHAARKALKREHRKAQRTSH